MLTFLRRFTHTHPLLAPCRPCVVNVLPPSATCTADFGYGVWTAVNATYARWEFQSIKPDYIGPANYTDVATFIKTKPVRS